MRTHKGENQKKKINKNYRKMQIESEIYHIIMA